MANSERSFPDRNQKVTTLVAAAAGFNPAYAPLDLLMSISTVTAKNTACEALNSSVATAITNWYGPVQNRIAQVALIKARSTAILSYIKPNPVWKFSFGHAKQIADIIRNVRPPRKATLPADPTTPAAVAARQRGAQSFADIQQNWKSLVNLVIALPGYAPPAANAPLQAANLTALLTTITSLNSSIPTLEQAIATLRAQRYDAYFGIDGLKSKFDGMKLAIKGQYTPPSTQWTQVKGLSW